MGLTTAAAIAAAVIAAGSAAYSGYVQNDNAIDQEKAEQDQAKLELEQGQAEADKIREKAAKVQGAQKAALAGSGVKLAPGTATTLLDETKRLSEEDAMWALKGANARAKYLRTTAGITGANGTAAAVAGGASAAGSLMNGANAYAKSGGNNGTTINTSGSGVTRYGQRYSLLGDGSTTTRGSI